MAVTFSDSTLESIIVNAYNNIIIEFYSSSSLTPDYAIITPGNLPSFQLAYNSNVGKFWINLKNIVKTLMSFDDDIDGYAVDAFYKENSYLELSIDFEIYFTDGTSESVTKTYSLLRSAMQIPQKLEYKNRGTSFPLIKTKSKVAHTTIFKGFPFDLGFFGEDINFSMTAYSSKSSFLAAYLATGGTVTSDVENENVIGAYRLILSSGDAITDRINGNNYNVITYGDYTIKLSVEDRYGIYLKWLNKQGSWDYYLFQKQYEDEIEDDPLTAIDDDTDNLWNSDHRSLSAGKESAQYYYLVAKNIIHDELDRIREIVDSPRVYLYLGEKGDAYDSSNWMQIKVTGKENTILRKNRQGSIELKATLPQLNNITL